MAQYRQSGTERFSGRVGSYPHYANNGAVSSSSSDHIAIGIRNGVGGASGGGASQHGKNNRWRRSVRPDKIRRLGIGSVVFVLCVVLVITVSAYYYISGFTYSGYDDKGELLLCLASFSGSSLVLLKSDFAYILRLFLVIYIILAGFDSYDGDFLTNVTRIDPAKVLEFGQGSVVHGRDSRYWDKDDRRRDDDYNEDEVEHKSEVDEDRSVAEVKKDPVRGSSDLKGIGLYNEAGRNELKKYEAEYQASLVKGGESTKENSANHEAVDMDPEDDDAIDSHDSQGDEYVDSGHDEDDNEEMHKDKLTEEVLYSVTKQQNMENDDGAISKRSLGDSSLVSKGGKSGKTSRSDTKRRGRGRRSSGDNL